MSRNALVPLNVVFLAYNALDATCLWAGAPPSGMSERQYAHEGAAWLTVALVVLNVVVGVMFRGALAHDPRAKWTRVLAYAWLGQGFVLALGTWWFRLPFRGSVPVLLVGSTLYVICTVAIGILVSTLTRNQVVAILLALIVTIMPSFLYSGFIYPISSMSRSAQLRTYLFPGRYFVDIGRGTFLKGTGFAELGPHMAILAAYTAVVLGTAALRFRKKLA